MVAALYFQLVPIKRYVGDITECETKSFCYQSYATMKRIYVKVSHHDQASVRHGRTKSLPAAKFRASVCRSEETSMMSRERERERAIITRELPKPMNCERKWDFG